MGSEVNRMGKLILAVEFPQVKLSYGVWQEQTQIYTKAHLQYTNRTGAVNAVILLSPDLPHFPLARCRVYVNMKLEKLGGCKLDLHFGF